MSPLFTAYLAPNGLEKELEKELSFYADLKIIQRLGSLFIVQGNPRSLIFSQWTWYDVQKISISSIGEASKKLMTMGKLWALYSSALHRRSSLIQQQLPKLKNIPLNVLSAYPSRQIGGWTLESEKTMWASSTTDSAYPDGLIEFEESSQAPSRAYLKLWEVFVRLGIKPKKTDLCLDMGSCPGGWTWVLSELGCQVISVDKAPLSESLKERKNIQYFKKDAFKLDPHSIPEIDWFFSDIICYPKDLWQLVQTWKDSGRVKNFVCTIKFQGETDFETLRQFNSVSGSKTLHLGVNKHEVTWVYLK